MSSSINIQTAKSNSNSHMDRESKVTYLLDPDCKNNEYQTFKDSSQYLKKCVPAAKEITGRKMQQKAKDNFIQEAVVNLESHHTLEDVKNTFDNLKKKFGGFEVFKIAVHKDEGYFFNKKEDLEYRPNKDIFFNEQDRKFYLDKKFTAPADLNDFEKRYNYHAHITFTKFDFEKGKNCRLNKKDMRDMQTIVADSLGMQRGKVNSQAKRMSHWQLKDLHDKSRKIKVNTIELKYNFRDMQRKITSLGNASVEDKKELHKLNSKVKNDKATIQELHSKISEYQEEKQEVVKALKVPYTRLKQEQKEVPDDAIKFISFVDEELSNQKTLINSLKTQNNQKDEQILVLEEKIISTQDMSLEMAKENGELHAENKELKKEVSKYRRFFSDLAEELGCQRTFLNIASALDTVIEQSKKYVGNVQKLFSESKEMQKNNVTLEDIEKAERGSRTIEEIANDNKSKNNQRLR